MSDFPVNTEVLVTGSFKKGIRGFIIQVEPTHYTHKGKIPVRHGAKNQIAWIESQHLKRVDSELPVAESVPINVTPMNSQEARECLEAIKQNVESLRLMVLDFKRRDGWKALGYKSWVECAQTEFNQGRAYLFRLVQAAEVEENLKSTIVDSDEEPSSIPTTQLVELAKLPPEQQALGLKEAEKMVISEGSKKRTAAHVTKAVRQIKQDKKASESKSKTQELHFMVCDLPVGATVTQTNVPGLPYQIEFHGKALSPTGYRCEYVEPAEIAKHSSLRSFVIEFATELYEEAQKEQDVKKQKTEKPAETDPILENGTLIKNPAGWLGRTIERRANGKYIIKFENGLTDEYYFHNLKVVEASPIAQSLNQFWVGDRIKILRHPKYAGRLAIITKIYQNTLDCKPDDGTGHLYLCSPRIEDVELAEPSSVRNLNWTPAAVDAAVEAEVEQDETYVPECLADCADESQAIAYLEQAAPLEVWAEFQGLLKRIAELENR